MFSHIWHEMSHFDQTLLGIIILFTILGLVRGMFTAFLSFVFCLASFAVSILFLSKLAVYLSSFVTKPYTANITAFFVLLIISLIIGALLNMILSAIFSQLGKGVAGRLLGGLVGLVHGVFITAIIGFVIYNTSAQDAKWYEESKSYSILNSWSGFIQSNYSSVKDWQAAPEKPIDKNPE